MFRKTLPALLALAACPLFACGSSPTEESTSSTSEPLGIRLASSCAAGAQTQSQWAWTPGTVVQPGDRWYPAGQTFNFYENSFDLYGAYNPSTGNVDAVLWVFEPDEYYFVNENDVCLDPQIFERVESSNPQGNSGAKAPVAIMPSACMTGGELATALSADYVCE